MNSEVTMSLVFGISSIIVSMIGGAVAIFTAIYNARAKKLADDLKSREKLLAKVFRDLHSFSKIEKNLVEKISSLTSENQDTILKQNRKSVFEETNHQMTEYSKPSKIQENMERFADV